MSHLRIAVLVDGLHTAEVFRALAPLVRLGDAELLLVYVRSASSRAGLEMVSRRPGHGTLPPHRRDEIVHAEVAGGADALDEAAEIARRHAASVESVQLEGDAGRAVCELAARRRIDLVVVRAGGRDRPPLGPASLGPTARFVADHCAAPVLLLRPAVPDTLRK